MLNSQTRYIVVYKDDDFARNRYYGPFVSQAKAQEFMAILPTPKGGGGIVCKPMQPYGSHDARQAYDEIIAVRNKENPHYFAKSHPRVHRVAA